MSCYRIQRCALLKKVATQERIDAVPAAAGWKPAVLFGAKFETRSTKRIQIPKLKNSKPAGHNVVRKLLSCSAALSLSGPDLMLSHLLGQSVAMHSHCLCGVAQVAIAVSHHAKNKELFKLSESFGPQDPLGYHLVNNRF